MENIILIPVLNPSDKTINLIKDLNSFGLEKIVVVNDGSDKKYNKCFSEIKKLNCILINHPFNKGKGSAIKTGIKYIKENLNSYIGVITVDADGQHLAKDVNNLSKELIKNKNKLILGVRDFNKMNVPFRSRFGNKFSSFMLKISTGIKCSDTQTGLRGIPSKYYDLLLQTEGSRYDFEMNFLNNIIEQKIEIKSVPIETVYEDNNSVSHFRPIRDAILIYKRPLKYILVSLISAFIDLLLFNLFTRALDLNTYYLVIVSTISARLISGIINFFLNKKWSFKSNSKTSIELFKYILLFISIMLLSSLGVSLLSFIPISLTMIKIVVDTILFVVSYIIQKKYIFKKVIK